MSFIGDFAKGDWQKGLQGMLGPIGSVISMAKGETSVGEGIADIGTSVASTVANSVAPGSGTLIDITSNTVKGAIKGQSAGEIMKSNVISAVGGAMGNVGKESIPELRPKAEIATAPVSAQVSAPELRPKATVTATSAVSTGAKGKVNSGLLASNGAQLGLSLLTSVMGAKQAKASNEVAQQSLLFQKQSYEEAKTEKESYKAGMKQSAQEAYASTQLFGSELYGASTNANLFTSYNTNGGQGNYSILSWAPKTEKS